MRVNVRSIATAATGEQGTVAPSQQATGLNILISIADQRREP